MISSIQSVLSAYTEPVSDVKAVGTKSSQSSQQALVAVAPRGEDTVKLSTTSQIQSMKQGGATVGQIAANLGLSESIVESDLGITSTSSSSSNEASILAELSAKH